MEKRESFNSRLGFILVSAGCAIGLGNVWKFPYICAKYGGAAFILIYLLFLVILGFPILMTEYAIGRGSRKSICSAYKEIETKNSRFHMNKYFNLSGNYILMMFYTMVCGWMVNYSIKMGAGTLSGISADEVAGVFGTMLANPTEMIIYAFIVIVVAFGICGIGLNKGVEKISKIMMVGLFLIMIVLVCNSLFLDKSVEGLKYYLVPSKDIFDKYPIGEIVFAAMSHAFFTLSIGIGCMEVFGSYLSKEHTLVSETINIVVLDTIIALAAGLIIIPACISYGIEPDAGPSLLFITLPNVFNNMPLGRFFGTLFFIFMSFAALSTAIGEYESIIGMCMDNWNISRKKAVMINIPLMMVLSLPAILGFNVLSGVTPFGEGSTLMDIEDFIVSQNLLPLGSITFILLVTRKHGWGWNNFIKEVNTGKGIKLSNKLRTYFAYILPLIIAVVYLKGYYDMFKSSPNLVLWMILSVALLAITIFFSMPKSFKVSKEVEYEENM